MAHTAKQQLETLALGKKIEQQYGGLKMGCRRPILANLFVINDEPVQYEMHLPYP